MLTICEANLNVLSVMYICIRILFNQTYLISSQGERGLAGARGFTGRPGRQGTPGIPGMKVSLDLI